MLRSNNYANSYYLHDSKLQCFVDLNISYI
jgi:hypothetical protein